MWRSTWVASVHGESSPGLLIYRIRKNTAQSRRMLDNTNGTRLYHESANETDHPIAEQLWRLLLTFVRRNFRLRGAQ